MRKPNDPRELAVALLNRSSCAVQVAAVLADKWGIFAWGHNHAGRNGYGEHAEVHCINRSNPHRLHGATMYVAARRRRNNRIVTARPCEACQRAIWGVGRVTWRDRNGVWIG